jgi:alkanesulfonate monooxygenase SsuD/methylene tetrahydromethanopterin reductase-like flavin-dependent oxidoreductase (luciferase family)
VHKPIRVGASTGSGFLELSVSNGGEAISPAALNTCFNPSFAEWLGQASKDWGWVSTSRPRSHALMAVCSMSIALGSDASVFDLDGPLPEIPESNASKSGRERVIERARRDNLTVRQFGADRRQLRRPRDGRHPEMIADQMEEWLYSDARDGFNIMFPWVPGGLDDFLDCVVPELQRRHLFRHEYEGQTLRENLGLPRPENRFF